MSGWDWKTVLRQWAGLNADVQRDQEAREAIEKETSRQTWYTVKEAADYLGVDGGGFRRRVVNAGVIPTHDLGERSTKIYHTDLRACLVSDRVRLGGAKRLRGEGLA